MRLPSWPPKKNPYFVLLHSRFPELCDCRKCDNVRLLYRGWRERDALRLRNAVFTPQVAIGFHRQRAAVFVSKPAGNSRNVHAAFDAARCEQVPQIVMRDAICADLFAGTIK